MKHPHADLKTLCERIFGLAGLFALALALVATPVPLAAQEEAELATDTSQDDILTEETLDMLQRTTAIIASTIESRASVLARQQRIKELQSQVRLVEEQQRLAEKEAELAQMLNPDEPAAAPVAVEKPKEPFFPVRSVSNLRIGARPRAKAKLIDGRSRTVTIGRTLSYAEGDDKGAWEVISISRDEVVFKHQGSGLQKRLSSDR